MSQSTAALATLVIAIISLVLSAISLTWQAATFVLSGSRVQTRLRHGAHNGGMVVSGLPGTQSLSALADQGFSNEVLGVEVRNVGRLAVQVTGINVALRSGVRVGEVRSSIGPELPHRLEAQSSASWFMPAAPIRAAVAASAAIGKGRDPSDAWMQVELGNGKTIQTHERISLRSANPFKRHH